MAVGSSQSNAEAEISTEMPNVSKMLIGQHRKGHDVDQPTDRNGK